MPSKRMTKVPGVFLCVDKDAWTGKMQVSINFESEDGSGYGYRISGPKYNGSSKSLIKHRLTSRDAEEIISYLKEVDRQP